MWNRFSEMFLQHPKWDDFYGNTIGGVTFPKLKVGIQIECQVFLSSAFHCLADFRRANLLKIFRYFELSTNSHKFPDKLSLFIATVPIRWCYQVRYLGRGQTDLQLRSLLSKNQVQVHICAVVNHSKRSRKIQAWTQEMEEYRRWDLIEGPNSTITATNGIKVSKFLQHLDDIPNQAC